MGADRAALERARVVLDAVAEAELLHHLQVVLGALADAVCLEHAVLRLELRHLLLELRPKVVDRALDRRLRGHVLGGRPDDEVVEVRVDLARQRVEVRDLLDFVAEEGDAIRRLDVRRLDLDEVALHAKAAAPEDGVVAHVLALDELAQHLVAVVRLPHLEHQYALAPLLGRAEAVDARDGRDDDDVAASEERRRRRQPKARDVVVPRRVLLDVEVGLRDVRLGLEVVVVRDEVLDGVVRKELTELVAELRGERLVVRDDERRALEPLDRPRHRRRLAGPGRTENRLEAVARGDGRGDLLDRARLVAHGRVLLGGLERPHPPSVAAASSRECPSPPRSWRAWRDTSSRPDWSPL